jgi:hypothetical protein
MRRKGTLFAWGTYLLFKSVRATKSHWLYVDHLRSYIGILQIANPPLENGFEDDL